MFNYTIKNIITNYNLNLKKLIDIFKDNKEALNGQFFVFADDVNRNVFMIIDNGKKYINFRNLFNVFYLDKDSFDDLDVELYYKFLYSPIYILDSVTIRLNENPLDKKTLSENDIVLYRIEDDDRDFITLPDKDIILDINNGCIINKNEICKYYNINIYDFDIIFTKTSNSLNKVIENIKNN